MKQLKTIFLLVALFFLAETNALASENKENSAKEEVLLYAENLKDRLYFIADSKQISEKDKLNKAVNTVMNEIDVHKVAIQVLGKYYNKLSDEEKKIYHKEYRKVLRDCLTTSAEEALLVKSKNVKLLKNIITLTPDIFDVSFFIKKQGGFILLLSLERVDKDKFSILNISVDNIDIVTNQKLLFRKQIEKEGLLSIFQLMKEILSDTDSK